MSLSKIQLSIIDQIKTTEDTETLETIWSLLQLNNSKKTYQLSDEQKESIAASRYQIEKGEFKHHDQVMEEAKKWLKGK